MSDRESRFSGVNPFGWRGAARLTRTGGEQERLPYIRRYHLDPLTGRTRPSSTLERVRAFVLCRPHWYLYHFRSEPAYGQELSPEFWSAMPDDRLDDVYAELYMGWGKRMARRVLLGLDDVLRIMR